MSRTTIGCTTLGTTYSKNESRKAIVCVYHCVLKMCLFPTVLIQSQEEDDETDENADTNEVSVLYTACMS